MVNVCERDKVDVVTLRRSIVRLSRVSEVLFAVYIQERVPKITIPIGRRNIEAWTRTDLNKVTARPLILHAFADCWVRTFTSFDPQA